MANFSVESTLELLKGMQRLRLVPQSVEVDDERVVLSNITQWTPYDPDKEPQSSDVLDGHGEPPES